MRLQMSSFYKIEEKVALRAPVARVWQAIANPIEFSRWFGIRLDGDFEVGKPITGKFERLPSEATIMEHQKRLGLPPSRVALPERSIVFCTPERIEPERYFSFSWIPYGIDADIDPDTERTTLVGFHLDAVPEGTLLTIVESGFQGVPAHRRERAFRMNESGWKVQVENIKKYLEGA
jgi:uncharacterized protein YndB with AHSA1/START domain